jgi:hypothetical protein
MYLTHVFLLSGTFNLLAKKLPYWSEAVFLCFKRGFRGFPENILPREFYDRGGRDMFEGLEINKSGEKDWEEIIPKGELELVSLNTMIPRKLSGQLSEATGWLQLASPRLRYTKQATVQYLLERGLQSLYEDIEKENKKDNSESEDRANIVIVGDNKMLNIIQSGKKEINFKDYEQFSNKHSGGYKWGR